MDEKQDADGRENWRRSARRAHFAGQTIYLLIEAADGGSGSLIEAVIDAVLIE